MIFWFLCRNLGSTRGGLRELSIFKAGWTARSQSPPRTGVPIKVTAPILRPDKLRWLSALLLRRICRPCCASSVEEHGSDGRTGLLDAAAGSGGQGDARFQEAAEHRELRLRHEVVAKCA